MAEIALVNPRFDMSYWGLERALPLLGKRANLPSACLPLLAALTPAEHRVTLVDENVEPIDFQRLRGVDIVGVTGMNVQRRRMREILSELKQHGVFTVVGGPWVTADERYFDGLADVIFVGEAEETWPRFLNEWNTGRHRHRYEQVEATDMTRVPTPRFDLLDMRHYLFGSVQFSRGCPFQCEFCDITVTFGRRPRLKSTPQVIGELEALRSKGLTIAFIVDDNLIANKKAIKELLRALALWQHAEGYPFAFFTEASLDLADDPELMRLMVEANVHCVFIGIESPNEESLRETKKFQNLPKGDSLLERVHRVQQAGLEVWCGMILGFDHDDPTIFAAHREFLGRSRIVHAMIGMLVAIPKTPLYGRLVAEGRLDTEDRSAFGTNVVPLRMSREALRDGYLQLMQTIYEPDAYFERLENLLVEHRLRFGAAQRRFWRAHPWTGAAAQVANVARCAVLYRRLMRTIPDEGLRHEYRRRTLRLLRARLDPAVLFVHLIKCAMHYHHHTMAADMAGGHIPLQNTF